MDWLISRTPRRMARPRFDGPRTIRHRTEDQTGQGAGGQGGSGGGSGDGDGDGQGSGQGNGSSGGSGQQGGSGGQQQAGGQGGGANADNAAQRLLEKERARAEAAEKKLEEAERAKLSDKERAERERDEARAQAQAAERKALLTERRVLVREAAQKAGLNPAVVADLSEKQLLELEADAKFDAKAADGVVTSVQETYSLQPADPNARPQSFGQPAGDGTSGAGGNAAGGSSGDPGATGDPKKDYRGGIGRGILNIVRGGGGAPESQGGSEHDDD